MAICESSPVTTNKFRRSGPQLRFSSLPSSLSQDFYISALVAEVTPVCNNNVHSVQASTFKRTHKYQIIMENKADTQQCILKQPAQLHPPSEDLTCFSDMRWQFDAVKSGALKSRKET